MLDYSELSLFLSRGRKPLGLPLAGGRRLHKLFCYTKATEIQHGPTRQKMSA